MTEPCKFEDDIGEIKSDLKDLVNVIKGVNATKPGLIHKVLDNQKSVGIHWWFIAVILIAVLSGWLKMIFF